jgi:hypothetical protein
MGEEEGSVWYEKTFTVFFPFKFFFCSFSLTICKKWGEKGGWGVEGLYKENPKKDITNTHAKCRGERK